MIRALLKRGAERISALPGPAHLLHWAARRHPLILAYHNVAPDGAPPTGDRSLHLPRAAFAAQLDLLAERCAVIPLAEVEHAESGDRPVVVITFDDAYRGAVTDGVAELARRGLPATIFVAPQYVGDGSFWWDELTPPGAVAPAVPRETALGALRGEDQGIRAWAAEHGLRTTPPPPYARVASEAELNAAVRGEGITLGSHTWSHPNLAALSRKEMNSEMAQSWNWLRARFADHLVPWISYPYGGVNPQVEEVAAATGYRGGLCIAGGRVHPGAWGRPHALPRYNVPSGVSLDGFRARVGAGPA